MTCVHDAYSVSHAASLSGGAMQPFGLSASSMFLVDRLAPMHHRQCTSDGGTSIGGVQTRLASSASAG